MEVYVVTAVAGCENCGSIDAFWGVFAFPEEAKEALKESYGFPTEGEDPKGRKWERDDSGEERYGNADAVLYKITQRQISVDGYGKGYDDGYNQGYLDSRC